MNLLNGITILLVYQLLGEITVLSLNLPIPGPVIGMIYLLVTLLVMKRTPQSVDSVSNGILSHLSLLFVPAGVGMMVYFNQILQDWLPIGLTLIISTLITLVTTAWVMMLTLKIQTRVKGKANATD